MTTKTVMMAEAVTQLSELLNLVDQGEDVWIVRENRPLRCLLKKYWIEARRAEIYRHYQEAKSLESTLPFASDLETLKSRLQN